jgi:predicted membrane-bound spermidine synthase
MENPCMKTYVGTFLIAFATLALEITITRLLSVTGWYYLAFFAISTAMLGMTAGATLVYLKPQWFVGEKMGENVARFAAGFAFIIPVSLVLLCITPLVLVKSFMSIFSLLLTTFACSLPFFFSGVVVTVVLTRYDLPVGKLYASDLLGASLGCLFVLGGLEVFDAPSLILLCTPLGILSAFCFGLGGASRRLRRIAASAVPLLILMALLNSTTLYGIRPLYAKGKLSLPGYIEKWNSFSRVRVEEREEGTPFYWGMSPVAPKDIQISQYRMNIDGSAGTVMQKFSTMGDIDHLRYDVTNVAYFLRHQGGACIIGVGAGRDVQSAILFGQKNVLGIELNPIFINLLEKQFRDFAGIAGREGVRLVVDDARSYLSTSEEKFAVIQMSMIDTWAATGAGAFSLSENALYTEEAWDVFFRRLSDDGIFTVSRWHNPDDLGETGRVVSLAMASLLRMGITSPEKHLAMVTTSNISTLLLCRRPFDESDIAALKDVSSSLQEDLTFVPGAPPKNPVLRQTLAATTLEGLQRAVAGSLYNFDPPTDEDPYFFNMLRLRNIIPLINSQPGTVRGNIIATTMLLALIFSLLVLTVLTVIIPVAAGSRAERIGGRRGAILWPAAFYFSLIGAGFMCIEIGLIQRLSVFLGHPIYALGVLLSTIIASAGIGSYLSARLPMEKARWLIGCAMVTSAAVLVDQAILRVVVSSMITSPILIKICLSVVTIFPLGVLLGFFFPSGMRIVRSIARAETAWYWALNGVFGVLFSALAVFFSIYLGISTNMYIGAGCYLGIVVCVWLMSRGRKTASAAEVIIADGN